MPNNPNWQDYDRDLEEVYIVAADLVAGRGGPDAYRARGADPRLLMPAFGRTPLIVGVWDERYGPLAAMCVAGFILHGTAFEDRFARMGITGDLIDAYELLERHYGPRAQASRYPVLHDVARESTRAPRAEGFLKLTGRSRRHHAPRRPALVDSTARPAARSRRPLVIARARHQGAGRVRAHHADDLDRSRSTTTKVARSTSRSPASPRGTSTTRARFSRTGSRTRSASPPTRSVRLGE
jgi:hypothetical protein